MSDFRPLFPALFVLAATTAQANVPVGEAAAVRDQTTSRGIAMPLRVLRIADPIHFEDRIDTDASGGAQLLFNDNTSITLGANASVTINRYHYDPDRQRGVMDLTLVRGLMRLVGGRITKQPEGAIIHTPAGTAAVRGGVAMVHVDDTNQVTMTLLFGHSLELKTASGAVLRAGPNQQIISRGAGDVAVVPASRQMVDQQEETLAAQPHGDNPRQPTGNAKPAETQRSADTRSPDSILSDPNHPAPNPVTPPPSEVPNPHVVVHGGTSSAFNTADGGAVQSVRLADGMLVVSSSAGDYRLPVPQPGQGTITATGPDGPLTGSYVASNRLVDGIPDAFAYALQTADGRRQVIMGGQQANLTPHNGLRLFGISDGLLPGLAEAALDAAEMANWGRNADENEGFGVDVTQDGRITEIRIGSVHSYIAGSRAEQQSGLVLVLGHVSIDANGVASVRMTRGGSHSDGRQFGGTLVGLSAGANNNAVVGGNTPHFVLSGTHHNGSTTQDSLSAWQQTATTAHMGQRLTRDSAIGFATALRQTADGRAVTENASALLSRDAVTSSVSLTLSGSSASTTIGGVGQSMYLGERAYGAVSINADGQTRYMLNGDSGTLPSLDPHQMESFERFARWGFWGGATPDFNGNGGVSPVHIGLWVTADRSSAPIGGTATYRGVALGQVHDGSNIYMANGQLLVKANFQLQEVTVNIDNFDGRNFSGFSSQTHGDGRFSTSLSNTASPSMVGHFAGQVVGNGARGVIGNWAVQDGAYRATGIGMGTR